MLKSYHLKRNESLDEYYYRMNRHLKGKNKVTEYDPERNELRIVGQNTISEDRKQTGLSEGRDPICP